MGSVRLTLSETDQRGRRTIGETQITIGATDAHWRDKRRVIGESRIYGSRSNNGQAIRSGPTPPVASPAHMRDNIDRFLVAAG